jgi:hypothetical protein
MAVQAIAFTPASEGMNANVNGNKINDPTVPLYQIIHGMKW